jgi:anti-sigma B factor antagonist
MDIGGREKNGYRIIDVVGKIDRLKDSMALKAHLGSIIENGVLRLALNLADVTYLDSGALNVLIHCQNMLEKRGSGLILISPGEYVSDVLNIVGIDRLITIYSTEEEFENEVQKS